MNVVLVFDIAGLKDKEIFDKYLKKEGFLQVKDEFFAYEGEAHTHLFNTKAYILEIASTGLKKSGFDSCSIMFQIGINPMETYYYSKEKNDFIEVEIK